MIARTPRDRAIAEGRSVFGPAWFPDRIVRAPGRLELLGNHVDYNGGLVLAGAVEQHICLAVAGNGAGGTVTILPTDVQPTPTTISINDCTEFRNSSGKTGPVEYTMGVIAALLSRGLPIADGQEVAIAGNVPLGFGMSSSAALCVGVVLALSESELSSGEIVTLAREAEHRSGSPVGAMDQSASIAGGIIMFDGRDTSFAAMKPDLGNHVFLVADSGISHTIGQSSYPRRVRESEEALKNLHALGLDRLPSLGELSPDQWAKVRNRFTSKAGSVLTDRIDHVVTEVERVRQGRMAAESGDWAAFGALMSASGQSSSGPYDISHPRVEELVAEMLEIDGVLGARMMGGGEGGPALALASQEAVPLIRHQLERGYFSRQPSHLVGERLLVASFGEGANVEQIQR